MFPKSRSFVRFTIISLTILSALSTVALLLIHHFGPETIVEYIDEPILEKVINYSTLFLNVVLTKFCISVLAMLSLIFYLIDSFSFESLVSLLVLLPGTVVYVESHVAALLHMPSYIDSKLILSYMDINVPNAHLLAMHILMYLSLLTTIIKYFFVKKPAVQEPQHPKKTDAIQPGDRESDIMDSGVSISEGYSETISKPDGNLLKKVPKATTDLKPSPTLLSPTSSMPTKSSGSSTLRKRNVRSHERVPGTQPKMPFTPSGFTQPVVDSSSKPSPKVYAPTGKAPPKFQKPLPRKELPKDKVEPVKPVDRTDDEVVSDLDTLHIPIPTQSVVNAEPIPTQLVVNTEPIQQPLNTLMENLSLDTQNLPNEISSEYLRPDSLDRSSNVEFLQSILNTPTFVPFGDMSRAISYSPDNILKLWDLDRREVLFEMPGHKSTISSIYIYDHNRYFVSSSWDKTLKIWDLETGTLKSTLTGFNSELTCVIVFGEGKRMITGSTDGSIEIWDTLTSKFIHSMKSKSHISAIRVTKDNKKFVASSFDSTITLWNISTGEVEILYEGHSKRVFSIELFNNDKYLISASEDQTLRVWEVDTGRCVMVLTGHQGSVQTVCLCNMESNAISGSEDGTLKVWDLNRGGTCIKTLDVHSGSIVSCIYSDELNRIVSYAMDKTLVWWDALSFEYISSIQMSAESKSKEKKDKKVELNILVATDDQESIENAQNILNQLGYTNSVFCQELATLKSCLHPNHSFNVVFFDVTLFGSEDIDESIFTQNSGHNFYVVILKSNEYWFLDINEIFNNVPCMLDVIHKPITGLAIDKALREVEDLVSQRKKAPSIGSRSSSKSDFNKHISPSLLQPQREGEVSLETVNQLKNQLGFVESKFRSFVAHQFFDIITPRGRDDLKLGDAVCRSVTVMFSDIRDFSTISENMSVSELMDFINCYYAFAIPPILEHGGFVDKFVGDSIMCLFAHQSADEQSIAAVNCAVSLLKNLDFMKKNGFMAVETGIGINTGRSIIGLVGTETRMEPTVLGDAVNLASRLESLCKVYHSRIVITEYTKEKMGRGADLFLIRELDYVAVKGKKIACRIFEVIDGDPPEVKQFKKRLIEEGDWDNALTKYQSGEFVEAKYLFEKCLSIYPFDQPSKIYIERCKSYISECSDAKPDDWNPIHRLDNK